MPTSKRTKLILLTPVLLVGSCFGKISIDHALYILPGKVLQSSAAPTKHLDSAMQVAEALDDYVQPRFEILRDKNFGAMRIVYRQHAGIVQLKVDTPREKEQIANVNAGDRDYAISLLHCVPKPDYGNYVVTPRLQLLYFNQREIASDWDVPFSPDYVAKDNSLDMESIKSDAVAVLPKLMQGKEQRTHDASWEVLMRPVRASSQECLNCHKNAKPGATLGVMVYAVRNSRRDAPAKIGLRDLAPIFAK